MVKSKRDSMTGLQWGLVILGIVATPIAIHAASVLALSGPNGLMLLYPFAQIVRSPEMNVPADAASVTAQWIMYLQFPLYGLLAAKLMRHLGAAIALAAAAMLHCVGMTIAYFLAHAQNLSF